MNVRERALLRSEMSRIAKRLSKAARRITAGRTAETEVIERLSPRFRELTNKRQEEK